VRSTTTESARRSNTLASKALASSTSNHSVIIIRTKSKKNEIRVKNGPVIQYNKLGNGEFGLSWPAGADQEIREAINFWLKHPDGKFSLPLK